MHSIRYYFTIATLVLGTSVFANVFDSQVHDSLSRSDRYAYPERTPEEVEIEQAEEPVPLDLPEIKSNQGSGIGQTVVIVLSVVALGTALYFILLNMGYIENRKNTIGPSHSRFEEDIEDIESIEVLTPLQQAIASQNWRLAIRLYYLQLLQNLNRANAIQWKPSKTNHDYLNETRGMPLFKTFKSILRDYELVWYGEVPIETEAFEQLELKFKSIQPPEKE